LNSMTVGENVALPLVEHTNLDPKIIEMMVKMKMEKIFIFLGHLVKGLIIRDQLRI
jgi:ABC-type transporter Mla maintaining outer membrane lipid asymmetry ATPase subunit MlaF